eukprot:296225-Pyramimonas_sp.AAC.1
MSRCHRAPLAEARKLAPSCNSPATVPVAGSMVTSLSSLRSGLLRYLCPSPMEPSRACSAQ